MPQVPTRDTALTPVPTQPSAALAGSGGFAAARAQAAAGASVQQGVAALADAAAQFSLQEIKREQTQEMNRADAAINAGLNDLEVEMRGRNDYQQFPGEFNLRAAEHIQGVLDTISNGDVRDVVTANAQNRYEQARRTIGMAASSMRAKDVVADLDGALFEDARAYALGLDAEQKSNVEADAIRRIQFSVDQGHLTPEQGEARFAKWRDNVANAAARTAITEDPFDFLARIDENDPEFSSLDPIMAAQFVDVANRRVIALENESERRAAAQQTAIQSETLKNALVRIADPNDAYGFNELQADAPRLSASGVNTIFGKLKEGATPNDRETMIFIQGLINEGRLDEARRVNAKAYADQRIKDGAFSGFEGQITAESNRQAAIARSLDGYNRGPSPYASQRKRVYNNVKAFPPEYISYLTAEMAQSSFIRSTNAVSQFDEWFANNQDADYQTIKSMGDRLIEEYGNQEILNDLNSLRLPYGYRGSRSDLTLTTINTIADYLERDARAGIITFQAAAEEARLLDVYRLAIEKASAASAIRPKANVNQ